MLGIILTDLSSPPTTTSIEPLVFARTALHAVRSCCTRWSVSILREELAPRQVDGPVGDLGNAGRRRGIGCGHCLLMTGDAEYRCSGISRSSRPSSSSPCYSWCRAWPRTRRGRSIGRVRWGWPSDSRPCPVGITCGHRCGLDVGPEQWAPVAGSSPSSRRGGTERWCAQPLVSSWPCSPEAVILLTNIATVLVGTGLYFGFPGVTSSRPVSHRERLRVWRDCSRHQSVVPIPSCHSRIRGHPSSADGTSIDSVRAQF